LTPESVESPNAEKKMVGSVFVFEAKDIAEVKKMVENDIYYTSGVVGPSFFQSFTEFNWDAVQWDPEKIVISPFQPAMPLP
jgi:uncharacterized protein